MTRTRRVFRGSIAIVALWTFVSTVGARPEPALLGLVDINARMSMLEATLSGSCDPSLLRATVDLDRLVMRAIGDLEAPEPIERSYTEGIVRNFDLASGICREVENGGKYSLLRVKVVDGRPRALFRMIGSAGVNYHEFLLEPRGNLRIVDIFVYSNGEWISDVVRRGFLPLARKTRPDRSAPLEPAEQYYMENLEAVTEMNRLSREGFHRDALAVYREMPHQLKSQRAVMMQRFDIAMRVGSQEYADAVHDLKQRFPNDPTVGLALIDYHFVRGRYARALASIDRMNELIGGDPYLDFFRANVLYAADRLAEAKLAARRAIAAEADLENPYWTLLTISLDEKEFVETARLLTAMERELGLVLGDIGVVPGYREFMQSVAYADWQAARRTH